MSMSMPLLPTSRSARKTPHLSVISSTSRSFAAGPASERRSFMPHVTGLMKHDVHGEVEKSDGHPFDAVAMIRHDSRDIKVGIIRDDQPLETTLKLVAEVVSGLAEL